MTPAGEPLHRARFASYFARRRGQAILDLRLATFARTCCRQEKRPCFVTPISTITSRCCSPATSTAGLRAIVAVHSSVLGPAFGGCRMWPYRDEAEALTDALRLSRGMTYKAAICELPYGGGKSVILGDPRQAKTPALLQAMGAVVDRLGGRYIIADDIGTTLDDLRIMRAVTAHTAAATPAAGQPLPVTACGVFQAIRAAVAHALGRGRTSKACGSRCRASGNVGLPLCRHLAEAGATLIVTDLDRARVAEAVRALRRAGGRARGDLRAGGRRVRALRARRRAERPDNSAPRRRDRLRRRQQPARRGAPRRRARRAWHPVRAGLHRQCRRRDRLSPGAASATTRPDAVLGAVARIHDITRRRARSARRARARRRSRSPTGSCWATGCGTAAHRRIGPAA